MFKTLKPKYSVLVFDFDNTLSNTNINASGVTVGDINEKDKTIKIIDSIKPLISLFNDYHKTLKIFKDLKSKGVKLIIASFGYIDNIKKILNIVYPNIFDYILTTDNIDEESGIRNIIISRYIVDSTCPRLYGKNIMLETIIKKFNISDPSQILFFDDDYSNAVCSGNIKVNYYNNSSNGITAKLLIDRIYLKVQDGGKRYVLKK